MSSPLPITIRVAIFVRDEGTCVYCGATYQAGAKLTVDHVVSRKRGGGDEVTNLVTACRACNEDKAHFSLRAYLVELAERGAGERHAEAVAARVEAARKTPVDWSAAKAALALYREHGRLPFGGADDG
jgi:predicted GNAT family N-acyltransferase